MKKNDEQNEEKEAGEKVLSDPTPDEEQGEGPTTSTPPAAASRGTLVLHKTTTGSRSEPRITFSKKNPPLPLLHAPPQRCPPAPSRNKSAAPAVAPQQQAPCKLPSVRKRPSGWYASAALGVSSRDRKSAPPQTSHSITPPSSTCCNGGVAAAAAAASTAAAASATTTDAAAAPQQQQACKLPSARKRPPGFYASAALGVSSRDRKSAPPQTSRSIPPPSTSCNGVDVATDATTADNAADTDTATATATAAVGAAVLYPVSTNNNLSSQPGVTFTSPPPRPPRAATPQQQQATSTTFLYVEDAHVVGDSPAILGTRLEEGDDELVGQHSGMTFHHRNRNTRGSAMSSFEISHQHQHPPCDDDAVDTEVPSGISRGIFHLRRVLQLSLIVAAAASVVGGAILLSSYVTSKARRASGSNSASSGAGDSALSPQGDGNIAGDDDNSKFWADSDEAIAYLRELRFTVLGIDTFRAGPIQLLATEWMTYTELQGTRIPLTGDLERVVQRYALLVFHFSNGGGEDWDQMAWAEPGSHECDWVGVECNSKGHVVALNLGTDLDLTGVLVTEIGLLSSLTSLDLAKNRFEGSIPTAVYSLTNLAFLNLGTNEFAGTLDDSIQRLSNLEELWLNSNYLSGTIPESLRSLENLKTFGIGTNRFVGEIWSFLLSWKNIEEFSIEGNDVGGAIPTELGRLSRLSSLDFSYTATAGTIPTEIGLLSSSLTEFFSLSSSLEGSLPTEIGNLSVLNFFMIPGAHLVDVSIPTELGRCTSLYQIDLGNSNMGGTIPTELGQLTELLALFLVGNRIQGTIPTELALLHKMLYLDLRGFNQELTGSVPDGICELNLLGIFVEKDVQCSCCFEYRY